MTEKAEQIKLPEKFMERMKSMMAEEYENFLKEYEGANYQSLRLNPLKINTNGKSCESLCREYFTLEEVSWEPHGFYYGNTERPGKHPYHDAGVYYIQEASAMLPVRLLQTEPGDYCLDLCAAPGGKSTQIAGDLMGKGLLVCNEIHPARAKILSENVERMGVSNVCVTNEASDRLVPFFMNFFDKILVDAPCSGEGMFRKNTEACDEWSEENVFMCAERQAEILDNAAQMLRPGGRLVYSTCTFAPEENERTIAAFLERHPDFTRGVIPTAIYEQVNYPDRQDGTIRVFPHRAKGEGHFAAVLERTGVKTERSFSVLNDSKKKKQPDNMKDFEVFWKDSIKESITDLFGEGRYLFFGDQLYYSSPVLPQLKGLKVLRPGLHLGTVKKNRFEPSHALALALNGNQAVHSFDLDSRDSTVAAYLNGQIFYAEGEKGWYLITVDGFSIGWGKLVQGTMKNHYPRGLRN